MPRPYPILVQRRRRRAHRRRLALALRAVRYRGFLMRIRSLWWFERISRRIKESQWFPTPPRLCPARIPKRAAVRRFMFRNRATWG